MVIDDGPDTAALLASLEAIGISLWLEKSQLRYRSPKGVMTPERMALLRSRRDEIVAALAAVGDGVSVCHDPVGRHDPFPLTDVQTAYLVGRGSGHPYGDVGCHGYGELRFEDVDEARLEKAWSALVRRHDMLRAVISADGTQRVMPDPPPYSIRVNDQRGHPRHSFTAAVDRARTEMDHRVYQSGEWPLFELRLSIGDEHAILHFSIDFLIADFVSIQLLLDELEEEYRDPGAVPSEPEITFRDVLLTDRARKTGARYDRDRAYWWDRLSDLPERPELPTRSSEGGPPRFRRLLMKLSAPEWSGLKDRAQRAGMTATGAVLAAYAEVIGRWSRQPRFTLNVTVLNRPDIHPGIRRIVGDFTSVELLAVETRRALSFRERAQAVQARLWDDLDHGLVSGIDVVRELRRRDSDSPSLFPIVFTSSIGLGRERSPGRDRTEPGGLSRLVYGISQTPQVWLDCQAMEADDGLSVNWDVREGIFPDGLVETMFGAFEGLLRGLADDEVWKSCCPVPVPADQLARRPAADHPRASAVVPLQERVLEQARLHPDRTAVVTPSRSLTYRELIRRAASVAALLEEWQCRPGAAVVVEMDKGWEQVAAVIGILAAGCAYVPIDTGQPLARRERILADVGAGHVLTQSWRPECLRRPGTTSAAVDTLAGSDRALVSHGRGDDLAYIIYTSGSTGAPKGVMTSHRAAWNTIDDVNRRFGAGPDDRVFGLANLGFDLSVYDIFGPLSVGGAVVLPDADRRADPGHWATMLDAHQVTVWNSVPSQLEMLMAYLRTDPDVELGALRLALLSGDWIPVSLPGEVWRRLPGLRLVGLGGATEASIWSIFHPISTVDETAPSIPYGRPLTGQTVEVLGDGMVAVPDLVPGELYLGGDGLSDGYFGDAAKTAERFVCHPPTGRRLYRTGDFGRYLPDGSIEFLGRSDSQIKIRGYRVELAEIQAALATHAAVGAAAVIAAGRRPEPIRLAAFVETAARRPDPARALPTATELGAVAARAAADLRAEVDDEQMLMFARRLDAAALVQMLAALRHSGLFADERAVHTTQEILERARVAPRHHRLVRRWLQALRDNGLISQEQATGAFTATANCDATAVADAWRRIRACVPVAERRTELITYFRTAADHLPELLRGELDPLTLLFPEGRTEIHEVAYTAMFLSRYLNRLLVSAARHLVRHHPGPRPLRVLEVGSGVGGTSVELIPALAEFDVEYLFSDVSEFFLNNARTRFREYPWVDYRLFDMNEDYRTQGLTPNSVELIVCANVLHYAKSVDAVLARLRELLTPGGWILFIEATRDSYQIMTSMEFLFDEGRGEFEDVRRARQQTFVTRPQWLDVLGNAGADDVVCLPELDPITDQMGMHLFAARFKSDRSPVRRGELEEYLADQLPGYMLPGQLQIVDRLPVTDNGKIDRKVLGSWLPAPAAARPAVDAGELPTGGLEERISEIWQRLLRVDQIGRHQNFFELGGDSLLAAQVATEIRESLPAAAPLYYDNVLRLLLENSTVASLATRIQLEQTRSRSAPSAAGRRSPLVRLGEGPGPTVVLVHDATGTLAGYRPLLDLLGYGMSVAGLQVADRAAYLRSGSGDLVDEMAGAYTRALVSAGHTRVRLVGQRFGGLLAAEVARQLTEVGVRVDRLVVVAAPPPGPADELLLEYLLYREMGVDAEHVGFPSPGEPQWADGLDALRQQPRAARFNRVRDSWPEKDLDESCQILRHSYAAASECRLLPYAGDITVVRPEPIPPWPTLPQDMVGYWRDVCLGDVEIIDVPGDYVSCAAEAAPVLSDLLAAAARNPR